MAEGCTDSDVCEMLVLDDHDLDRRPSPVGGGLGTFSVLSSQAQVSSVVEGPQPPPAADGGRITQATIGLVVAGALALAALVLLALRRRRRMVVRPRVT